MNRFIELWQQGSSNNIWIGILFNGLVKGTIYKNGVCYSAYIDLHGPRLYFSLFTTLDLAKAAIHEHGKRLIIDGYYEIMLNNDTKTQERAIAIDNNDI